MNTENIRDLLYTKPDQRPNLHKLILEALIDGKELTTLSALKEFRTMELQKFISDLRNKMGIPIGDRWTTNPATGKRFKVYFLSIND